jgi:NAD(P)-dependent dehydrogenase (short-subunit alcohol dehydrogenase family)
MTEPANKAVLITGAGGGFGRHMVRQFRAAGAQLILADVSDRALRHAIDDAGEDLVASVVADLATEEGCGAVAESCTSRNVVPDILVNNVGVANAAQSAGADATLQSVSAGHD